MNIENVKKLLAALKSEDNPVAFDMSNWFTHNNWRIGEIGALKEIMEGHSCGNAACLAGHAEVLAMGEKDEELSERAKLQHPSLVAAEWLGFTSMEEYFMFMG